MYENSPSERLCSPRMPNHSRLPKRRNHDQHASSSYFFSNLLEHDPEKAWPGLDPGWIPVFGKACPPARPEGSCSKHKLDRDDDSKKSHLDLARPARAQNLGVMLGDVRRRVDDQRNHLVERLGRQRRDLQLA